MNVTYFSRFDGQMKIITHIRKVSFSENLGEYQYFGKPVSLKQTYQEGCGDLIVVY